jgi:TolB protein
MTKSKWNGSRWSWALAGYAAAIVSSLVVGAARADEPTEDPLANLVVTPDAAARPLPKVALIPSLAFNLEDVTLRSVVQRDLELSGEFEVLPDGAAPPGDYSSSAKVDVKAWAAKGAEALVRVAGRSAGTDQVELFAEAYLVEAGDDAVFTKTWLVPASRVRAESHYVTDQLLKALTGTEGGFFSHLTFVAGSGSLRRVYRVDADGFDAKPISPPEHVALAPAYGPQGELYWAGSVDKDEYKIYRATKPDEPVKLNLKGSVYGLAWSRDHAKVAVSLGQGSAIKLFVGPSLEQLAEASPVKSALRPGFTPSGLLAFAGEGKYGQRIYVDGKAITPEGVFASAPTFCKHPDGIRTVFAAGVGKSSDLVSTGEKGGGLVRLTQGQGSNAYPACSPDGRLVAFFSTRKSGEGPGLYVMRVDGGRPKRVSTLQGDSLRWDRLPPTKSKEASKPAAQVAPGPAPAGPAPAAPAQPAIDPAKLRETGKAIRDSVR